MLIEIFMVFEQIFACLRQDFVVTSYQYAFEYNSYSGPKRHAT